MSPPILHFSVIADSEDFLSLRESWNALCERAGRLHVFSSFEWYWNAWTHVAQRRGYRLRILTGAMDGRIALIWPLMTDSRVLRMLSSDTLEYRDILVEPSQHASQWVDQAWSHLLASVQADAYILQNLRHPSTLAQKLSRLSGARSIGGGWCPVIRLDQFASWEAYAATLPKSLRSDQRRQWKRVRQALPGIRFEIVGKSHQVKPIMDWVGHHKVVWAEARGIPSVWFRDKDKRVLLETFAKSALNDGNLMLATLAHGDTILSAGWGYVCADEFLFHAFAYDEAYATYSPSRLFLESLVQWCFQRGVRTLDFMPGEEAFKRLWATDYVRTETYIGPLNWRGAWLMRRARPKPKTAQPPTTIERIYQTLPVRLRNLVRGRLREYRLLNDALGLRPGRMK